jgi:uncharacterized protein (DUF1778 family)
MKKISGRPKLPQGQVKAGVVRARVSQRELHKIEKAAKSSGLKLSDWVRKVLLDNA